MRSITRSGAASLALVLLLGACTEDTGPRPVIPDSANGNETPSAVEPEVPESVGVGSDLYRFDPTTGEADAILLAKGNQQEPERSPDGTRLAYQSEVPGGAEQIFVLEQNGTEHQLTDFPGGALEPAWSPDGSQIAFAARSRTGNEKRAGTDIFVMNADGSHVRRLVGIPRQDRDPDWSPDGSRIVFQHESTYYRSEIWVVSVADSVLRRLTRWQGSSYEDPAWSPDGRWITYTRWALGTLSGKRPFAHLMLMRADGTERERLDHSGRLYGTWELSPSWSPDGRSIAFTGWNCSCIHVIDVQTKEAVLLDTSPLNFIDDLNWGTNGIVGCGGCERNP